MSTLEIPAEGIELDRTAPTTWCARCAYDGSGVFVFAGRGSRRLCHVRTDGSTSCTERLADAAAEVRWGDIPGDLSGLVLDDGPPPPSRRHLRRCARQERRTERSRLRRALRVMAAVALVLGLLGAAGVALAATFDHKASPACGTGALAGAHLHSGHGNIASRKVVGTSGYDDVDDAECADTLSSWLTSVLTMFTGLVTTETAKHTVADEWATWYTGRETELTTAKTAAAAQLNAEAKVTAANDTITSIVAQRTALATAEGTTTTKVEAAQAARDRVETLEAWFTANSVDAPAEGTTKPTSVDPTSG